MPLEGEEKRAYNAEYNRLNKQREKKRKAAWYRRNKARAQERNRVNDRLALEQERLSALATALDDAIRSLDGK